MATWIELLASAVIAFTLFQWLSFHRIRSKLGHIPTLGSDWFILSYFDAWKFIFKAHNMIPTGYTKYNKSIFKMPTLTTSSRWLVVVSDLEMIEDMRKAPSDVLSFRGASLDLLQSESLLKDHIRTPPFHVPVVRTPLTRGFSSQFGEVSDEIKASCNQWLDAGDDWKAFVLHKSLVHVVCRTSNRFFVGLPLCRNPEYLKIQENWTLHVMLSANLLNVTPNLLKPIISAMLLPVHSAIKKVEKILAPVIQQRLDKLKLHGQDWEGRPNDMITWLINAAPPENRNIKDISMKVTLLNFAAIHTTSLTSTNILFDLAARQEYIAPLRAEIEEAIASHGWSKDAMNRMRKLDSFMKESSRLSGFSGISMRRKVMKDFVFTNGTVVPAGVTVAVASGEIQIDPEYYEDPRTFKGFRFSDMRENGSDELDPLRHQMISLDPTYMLFGFGRHACPGRFFAVNEVKALLAYIILNYDIKLEGDSTVPPDGFWFGGNRAPSSSGEVLLRKRRID
ncbi:cytochrome P450 [Ephemerocybe angulata]|uniref:Cytochrome P450 n=1 Tax=Ephemerocybe angulata TaxID=980116 RepID=A0A8H6HPZ9_9AGAR|nr:cytochrome P450 [Tulosesus angulatus]